MTSDEANNRYSSVNIAENDLSRLAGVKLSVVITVETQMTVNHAMQQQHWWLTGGDDADDDRVGWMVYNRWRHTQAVQLTWVDPSIIQCMCPFDRSLLCVSGACLSVGVGRRPWTALQLTHWLLGWRLTTIKRLLYYTFLWYLRTSVQYVIAPSSSDACGRLLRCCINHRVCNDRASNALLLSVFIHSKLNERLRITRPNSRVTADCPSH